MLLSYHITENETHFWKQALRKEWEQRWNEGERHGGKAKDKVGNAKRVLCAGNVADKMRSMKV